MTAQWYVLIEEDTRESRNADGNDLKLHRWTLVASHHISGVEADALAVAEDAALRYVPALLARHSRPGDVPARSVFLAPDGSWLVRLKQQHRDCHIRVTVARLVHKQEEVQAPPRSFKQKLRHALDGPEALPEPWVPAREKPSAEA
ncbi:hypothetical protein [Streptomyces sp. NPDC059166]|uniref:hypothetical protein n=1 Tax=Streptomyces sp. NPDC059166 TaxID=3346752 RepID=UPI0036C1084B